MSSGIKDGEPTMAGAKGGIHMPVPSTYPPATVPPPPNAYPAGTPPGAYPPAPPVAAPPNAYALQEQVWSTGLCDCMNDIGNCCITCWCPCITFGRIAEIVDRGSTSCGVSGAVYAAIMYFTCCQWIYSFAYRTKLRAQYNLPESPCCDCCVHYCCQHCALCQEYRELKNRGFDMNIGWQLNVQRASGGMQPPMMQPGMMR